jgi:hypothetical protein
MESSKLNVVHTNRVERHNGVWMGIWEGTVVASGVEQNVRVYIMAVQPIAAPRLKYDGETILDNKANESIK